MRMMNNVSSYDQQQFSLSPNALWVLEKHYLARDEAGRITETPEQLFRRVAMAIAATDRLYGADDALVVETASRFEALMRDLRFLPNTPTLMNAGKPYAHPEYSACFVALACRLASTILRLGGTMEQVLEQFYKAHREYGDVSTPILALMRGIQKVMEHAGQMVVVADRCPECSQTMRMQEGCMSCGTCGFSRC